MEADPLKLEQTNLELVAPHYPQFQRVLIHQITNHLNPSQSKPINVLQIRHAAGTTTRQILAASPHLSVTILEDRIDVAEQVALSLNTQSGQSRASVLHADLVQFSEPVLYPDYQVVMAVELFANFSAKDRDLAAETAYGKLPIGGIFIYAGTIAHDDPNDHSAAYTEQKMAFGNFDDAYGSIKRAHWNAEYERGNENKITESGLFALAQAAGFSGPDCRFVYRRRMEAIFVAIKTR
ncbi:MAG: hypothetical protein EYC62_06590 [Alphaproteobacteria bacterium]|nr:MAG: hypothetical protein EYC62_06590 [Alphaproteobacteria bacterium]